MTVFFCAAFVFCLGYLVILTAYAGQILAQSEIWLVFAAFQLLNAGAAWCWHRGLKQIPLWLVTALHTTAFAGLAVLTAAGVLVASGLHPGSAGKLDYVIVLGASVKKDGRLSLSLKRRLDRAAELAVEEPETAFVLSGGQQWTDRPSQAESMAQYLQEKGVAPERLLLEIQSKNTYENVVYSFALIDRVKAEEQEEGRAASERPDQQERILSAESIPVRVGILSNDYHMYRALRLAEHQTGKQVLGIAVPSDRVLFLHYMVREALALLKDKFLGRL